MLFYKHSDNEYNFRKEKLIIRKFNPTPIIKYHNLKIHLKHLVRKILSTSNYFLGGNNPYFKISKTNNVF